MVCLLRKACLRRRTQAAEAANRRLGLLSRALLVLCTALVVTSSTAGSFGFYSSSPQAEDPDDMESDMSRERSADRSRPSRSRVTRPDHANAVQAKPPQAKPNPPAQPPRQPPAPKPNPATTVAAPVRIAPAPLPVPSQQ
jgi:hypothetical protein